MGLLSKPKSTIQLSILVSSLLALFFDGQSTNGVNFVTAVILLNTDARYLFRKLFPNT